MTLSDSQDNTNGKMPEKKVPEQTAPETSKSSRRSLGGVWGDERRQLVSVCRLAVGGLYRSQIPRMSAALAYRTIFSIIPVMAIGLLIFGSFVSEDEVDSGVRRVLEYAGISQIAISQVVEEVPVEEEVAEEEVGEGDEAVVPSQDLQLPVEGVGEGVGERGAGDDSSNIEQVISDLINRVNTSIRNVPTGWIAMASLVVLIYAAMSMLIEIEKSFNQLCGAPSGRPWLRRLMLYWTMLTLGTLLLAATFVVGDALARWILSVSGEQGNGGMVGAAFASFGVSVLISTLLLLTAYLTIPNTKIKIRSALAGAFFAAIVWEIGKSGFTMYLRSATGYTKFYGSLALLPLFLLWVYLTWLIVLMGMQATHAMQHFTRLVNTGLAALSGEGESNQPVLLDPLVFIAAGALIGGRFADGKTTSADQLAGGLDIEPALAATILEALQDAGLVNLIAQGDDADDAFALSRPSDQIQLSEFLDAGASLDRLRDQSKAKIPGSILGAARESMGTQTLAELLK